MENRVLLTPGSRWDKAADKASDLGNDRAGCDDDG